MADPLLNRAAELDSPAWDAAAVTPNNSTDLPRAPTRGLYTGSGGDISVIMAGGTTVLFADTAPGSVLAVRVDRVRVTDTVATGIVALY